MLHVPTLDGLLDADVGVVDQAEKMGDHMPYMISTELVMMRPTARRQL
jgi:hypothetical protein